MKPSLFRDKLQKIIKSLAAGIGPESIITEESYPLEHGLKIRMQTYLGSIDDFQRLILNIKKPPKKETLNSPSIYQLYFELIKKLCNIIKDRTTITGLLDQYLNDTDVVSIEEEINHILKVGFKEYKVTVITNLIRLDGINGLEIGRASITKIENDFFNNWPSKVENQSSSLAAALLGAEVSKESAQKKYQGMTALETSVTGYHLRNEKSHVLETAISVFRNCFSYIYICKEFLSSVAGEKYNIKTEKIREFSSGFSLGFRTESLQDLFIASPVISDPPTFGITAISHKMDLAKEVFTLSRESIEIINKRCYLETYNLLSQCEEGKIKDKLSICQDWYLKSFFEDELTDQTISLFISLESLMVLQDSPLTSHTDEMAGNIAILIHSKADDRYKYKQDFKNKIYQLRNDIMHRGIKCTEADAESIWKLKISITWSVIGLLRSLEKILQYGNDVKALREYFEKLKLGGSQ